MGLPAGSKHGVFVLLLAWPAAVGAGWLLARGTGVQWPAAVLPAAWLGVVFVVLRRYASSDPR